MRSSWMISPTIFGLYGLLRLSGLATIPGTLGLELSFRSSCMISNEWITHLIVASSICISNTSALIDFARFSSTLPVNSGVLMVSCWWQCCFLHQTFAMRNLTGFTSFLTLKMNDRPLFKNVAISKLKCSSANEPLTECLFISSVNLCYDMFRYNRIWKYDKQSAISRITYVYKYLTHPVNFVYPKWL